MGRHKGILGIETDRLISVIVTLMFVGVLTFVILRFTNIIGFMSTRLMGWVSNLAPGNLANTFLAEKINIRPVIK